MPTPRTPPLVAALLLLVLAPFARAAEPVDPALILSALRGSLAKGPIAQTVRVSIKPLGKPARTDEFTIRLSPGRAPDAAGASLRLEMGDLIVYAGDGTIVATHAADATACFVAQYTGPLRASSLSPHLPPIPAPLLALALPSSADTPVPPNVSLDLTPYTPRITWRTADVSGEPDAEIVTLRGVRDPFPGEHPAEGANPDSAVLATLVIDASTSRPTRFSAVLPDSAELRLDFQPIPPGEPASWAIDPANRTRVDSLTALRTRRGDAAIARTVPEMTLMDAQWRAWEYLNVFRPMAVAPSPTHLVIIFIRETAAAPFGTPTPGAAAAEAQMLAIEASLAAPRDGSGGDAGDKQPRPAVRPVHVIVPVMLKMDEASRRKVEAAVKLRDAAGAKNAPPGALVWAPSPERTIERFAPNAEAVAIVIRADNSLAGVIQLDGRADKPEQISADLRTALGLPTPK